MSYIALLTDPESEKLKELGVVVEVEWLLAPYHLCL